MNKNTQKKKYKMPFNELLMNFTLIAFTSDHMTHQNI